MVTPQPFAEVDTTVHVFGSSAPRKRLRGSAILKKERRAPHIRVMRPEKATSRISAKGPDAEGRNAALLWINHPNRPRRQPVTVSATQTTTQPLYVLTRPRFGSRITEAKDPHGQVIATIKSHRIRSILQTHWTVHSASGTRIYSITERPRDALWRRTLGVPSRLDGDAFIFAIPGMLLSFFKGPVQMKLKNECGHRIGVVTFCPGLVKPREDFCIYLDDDRYPFDNAPLTAGVLAAMQRTN